MADDLVLYTNPMSRGRVVRWMLEETGEPYRVEVLDYATTMKGAGLSRHQSDGQGAGAALWRRRRHRDGGDLRLPGRCLSASAARAACRRPVARALLSLAVLHGGAGGGGGEQQGTWLCGAAGARAHDRLRPHRNRLGYARSRGLA